MARLRQTLPATRIIVRGDCGFCRQRPLRPCERAQAGCVIGLACNARLEARVACAELMPAENDARTGVKQRWTDEFAYAAAT